MKKFIEKGSIIFCNNDYVLNSDQNKVNVNKKRSAYLYCFGVKELSLPLESKIGCI